MFNLRDASESIRKAAALRGVQSGKFEPVFDQDNQTDAIVAKVYNRNHPDGIEIMAGEAENALNYTWREINNSYEVS